MLRSDQDRFASVLGLIPVSLNDLKDEYSLIAVVKCFGHMYVMPQPFLCACSKENGDSS